MNKLMNNKNMINYRNFLMIIYIECRDDTWVKCLNAFRHFLKKECNDDLFIFIVKINNLCNNISIKRTVELDRMHRFLKGRIGVDLDLKTVSHRTFQGILSYPPDYPCAAQGPARLLAAIVQGIRFQG